MKQMYISSVSSDNLRNENICGWIISPLLMQKWGGAFYFSLADLQHTHSFINPTQNHKKSEKIQLELSVKKIFKNS